MNTAAARALADATLAALIAADPVKGTRTTPDADTTVLTTVYNGPFGRGFLVTVIQSGRAAPLVTVRHSGPETGRARADATLEAARAAQLAAANKNPYELALRARIAAAVTLDDLLFNAADASADTQAAALLALRDKCANHSQIRLDTFAAGLGYDSINTLKAAQFSTVEKFRREGLAGQAAWDLEWSTAQTFTSAVLDGTVAPTFENYAATLPASFTPPA